MLNKLSIYQEDMVLIASHSLGEIRCQEDLIGKEIFMWTEGCPYRAALEEWLKLKNISPYHQYYQLRHHYWVCQCGFWRGVSA